MLKNETAVSSIIGISIILIISLLSIGLMLIYTAPLISETPDMAKAQKVEQAFTVFDSRTSKSSLGESPLQTTALSLMGETVAVHGNQNSYNESRMMIITLSSNSSWYNNFYSQRGSWNAWKNYENEQDFAGFNASMGKVRYYSGDRIIAYEGGGVWSRYPSGGTVMISPPEFHYNGETLTLPIMKISGDGSTGGSTNANINVRSSNTPVVLYPNTDPITGNVNFTNPLNCDKIFIYINSEFYDGWAKYAETLTSTTTILDHKNKTAIIEMDTMPKMGIFPLKHSFKIGRLNQSNPEPIEEFLFYYESNTKDASNFNAVTPTVTATAGTKKLVYNMDSKQKDVTITITYTDTAYLDGKQEEKWISTSPLYIDVDPDSKKNATCTINLTNDSCLMKYSSSEEDFSWGPVSHKTMTPDLLITSSDANSTQSLNNVTQHYMKLLAQDGTIDCSWDPKLKVKEKNNNNKPKLNEKDSTYTLIYDGGGAIRTYLHITSNELEVTLE